MSKQLIEFSLENGKSIFVEERCSDEEVRHGESEASLMGDMRDKIQMSFTEAMEATRGAAEIIIQQIDSLKNSSKCPEEIDVEFGIKLGSKLGAPIISSLDGEVNLKVTLKWMK
ncbi:MAG: CU044_2847 family protein [Candidatus Electrothrix aestuarii]|uniref:CU044_2847 family protein n=1 Tax=Candidatus Electrothrix aestuarii TaxID=3062594 RepID=A0AAU8LT79_9BACT|nr:CU044_2847 family protein [Candidatus Electrothrix aestuarii]